MPKVTNEKQRKRSKSNKKIKDNEIENNTRDTKDNRFSFDEEIVIGLKRIDEPKIEKRNKRTNKTNKANKTKKGKKGKNNIKNKNAKEYLNNNISVNATQIITDINYIQDADISNYASISSGSSTTPTNAAHTFTVNLKTFNEDVLVINGNTVILGYSNNQGWIKASTYSKQNIGGYLFEI